MCCQIFSKCIGDLYLMECYQFIWNGCIVFGKAYISHIQSLSSVESIKLITAECSCDLSCTVRTEIEEDNRVLVLNSSVWFTILFQICRNHELICLLIVIRFLDCFYDIICSYAFSFYQCIVSQLYTNPAIVTVHRIVTSHNRNHFADTDLFHFGFQLLYITLS